MSTVDDIFQQALSLDVDERVELSHRLMQSVESEDFDPEVRQAWIEEIKRRAQSLADGTARTYSLEETMQHARQSLQQKRNL